MGTQSPTWILTYYARLTFASPDVTAGWAASPVDTRPLGPHLISWVDWSNVSKVSCSRKQ